MPLVYSSDQAEYNSEFLSICFYCIHEIYITLSAFFWLHNLVLFCVDIGFTKRFCFINDL